MMFNSLSIEQMLTVTDGHYSQYICDKAIPLLIIDRLYDEKGQEIHMPFLEYLVHMRCTYLTSRSQLSEVCGRVSDEFTDGDCYYALAKAYASFGDVVKGDKATAARIANSLLLDPNR